MKYQRIFCLLACFLILLSWSCKPEIDLLERPLLFPQQNLNIQMDTQNFTTNSPVITWNSYPGANGYFILVLLENKYHDSDGDELAGIPKKIGNGEDYLTIDLGNLDFYVWNITWYEYAKNTGIQFFIQFTESYVNYSGLDTIVLESDIVPGDIIRIEVYALDGSGTLDLENRTGALCMDSLNVVR